MPWAKACESVVLRVPWCSEFSRRWVTRYPKLWDVAVMQDFAKCYKSFFQFLEVDIERNWDSFASTTNGSRLGIGFLVYKDDHGVLQQRFCFQLQVLRLIVFVHQIFCLVLQLPISIHFFSLKFWGFEESVYLLTKHWLRNKKMLSSGQDLALVNCKVSKQSWGIMDSYGVLDFITLIFLMS